MHEDLLLKQHLFNTSKSGIESNLMALTTEATLALHNALSNSDPRTYREECARAKVALELLQVIGIKEYAVKTMYKHTNQDDGLMNIVD